MSPALLLLGGGLLVLTGFLFLTGQMTRISFWLLEAFPGLQQIG